MFTITQTFYIGFVAHAQAPERTVQGHTLHSRSLPAADLTFDSHFKYAGAQRFELYGVADAEQHFFIDATPAGDIQRLYWMQFEHYLPSNDHRYNYKPDQTTDIGGLRFIYDSRLYTDFTALQPRTDSDGAYMRRLLQSKGFKLPKTAARIRLIHLPEPDNRSELMIIYLEALSSVPPDAKNEMPAPTPTGQLLLQHAGHALKISTREPRP